MSDASKELWVAKAVLFAVVILSACHGSPTTPFTPTLPAGTYTLAFVDGAAPPVLTDGGKFDSTWVLAGQVTVSGGTATLRFQQHHKNIWGEDTVTTDPGGNYNVAVEGDSVWLSVTCGPGALCIPGLVGRFDQYPDHYALELTLNEIPRGLPLYSFSRTR